MINRGLLYKSYREARTPTLLFAFGFFLMELILANTLPQISEQSAHLLNIPFVRTLISAVMGMDVGDHISTRALMALAWIQPAVLTLVFAQIVVFCTRLPAGEIDRGTLDMMLAWPASRTIIYSSESFAFLAASTIMLLAGTAGSLLGNHIAGTRHLMEDQVLVRIVINFAGLYLAVGGTAFLFSALCNRRGQAATLVFIVILFSFMLNFIERLWPGIAALRFINLLHYFQPVNIITGRPILWDTLYLATAGLICWTVGLFIFKRKDILLV